MEKRPMLERITSPEDLAPMVTSELEALAEEIREFLVTNVSKTGGHLGPNLGVVELTIALHKTFDSHRDSIVFDTGHQTYVHKILTGRHDFSELRHRNGLSGYPSRGESEQDIIENSHASTALSWADGISRGNLLAGREDAYVVAVIGDGAMTGGMAWEALNNIADGPDRRLIIVVNDNGRSYAPTIGGLAHHLDALRTRQTYEDVLAWGKRNLQRGGKPGQVAYGALHGLKRGIKDVFVPNGMFEDLGIKYVGPVDGHDIAALEFTLERAKEYGRPVIVHAITEKGRGYQPAVDDEAERFHAVGQIHPETGLPVVPSRFGWTAVFSDEILSIARERPDVVGITAAMMGPVGLGPMAAEFPDRVIDVGIAEQHALTCAAGLAYSGMHPVVALYATFLNRAFDQLLMDVSLHNESVTVVLDRAGLTGDDGASHNGVWDLSMAAGIPGLSVAVPRDEERLREELREAVSIEGPTLIRYPKGPMFDPIATVERREGFDIIGVFEASGASAQPPHVLLVGLGPMSTTALQTARILAERGISSTVVDPRWVLPVSKNLIEFAFSFDFVVHIEDGVKDGGVGSVLRTALDEYAASSQRSCVPVKALGVPLEFITQASRAQLIERFGLEPEAIAENIEACLSRQRRA